VGFYEDIRKLHVKVRVMSGSEASRREFLLYWAGLFVVAFAVVSIFISISNLVANVLSYNCYVPIVSGMLGIPPPQPITNAVTVTSSATFINGTVPNNFGNQQLPQTPYPYPYYCTNQYVPVAILTFVFNLLGSLIFTGVGAYMMLNGKKR
jgi:hypothetical protein